MLEDDNRTWASHILASALLVFPLYSSLPTFWLSSLA